MSDTPLSDEDQDYCRQCGIGFCSIKHAETMERDRADLLAALEKLMDACEAVNDGYYPVDAMDLARAAIARAKGEV